MGGSHGKGALTMKEFMCFFKDHLHNSFAVSNVLCIQSQVHAHTITHNSNHTYIRTYIHMYTSTYIRTYYVHKSTHTYTYVHITNCFSFAGIRMYVIHT